MKQTKNTFLPIFLLSLFTVYQVNITMFTHAHNINGVIISHSHPFKNKSHTHSKASLIITARLSYFHTEEVKIIDFTSVERPLLWQLKSESIIPIVYSTPSLSINLRAPPVC